MATCAFVSFRLGMTDGVSVVARNWQRAMGDIGFDVVTVAGEGPVDRTVPGLAIGATNLEQADLPGRIADALDDIDLVVVENLLSIPLNLTASRALAAAIAGRPAILHHHDPPWQRSRFAHINELPPRDPAWRHVVINHLTVGEMADRGITSTCIYNGFPTSTGQGDRSAVREWLGVAPDELVLAHPVRAIERKNVPAAIELSEQTRATYWLWGDAEDGYDTELNRILASARCRIVRGAPPVHAVDLYQAADAVVFPSTWEGFGNPPVEAAIHRVAAAVGRYPVADELLKLGFRWLPTDNPQPLRNLLSDIGSPETVAMLDHNREVAIEHLSLEKMGQGIRSLLDEADWLP